ncbi:glycosyl hydrolase [Rhodopseudomonas sp. BR0G17]|uniref:glycosyl hydrolase n=1 Tax=Rhodopseudomonas sp. BR0G17 TaxID=2269368 RepID=UPI0013E01187|nr:glycosyl hydrolase [Rhodopseudomonas sp. BR0G17]NEW97912.1 glycosyl hydrolase [Rhodopseudomonas sp. BR0G17]
MAFDRARLGRPTSFFGQLSARARRLVPVVVTTTIIAAGAAVGQRSALASDATGDRAEQQTSPWGVATGAEWLDDHRRFNPILAKAGVKWLRAFQEWQTIQPTPGIWNWAPADRLVSDATANGISLLYPLAYLAPWASADGGTRAFPIKDIQYWKDYVGAIVERYRGSVKHWEIWNEFNGSFAVNGNPSIYAELVKEASLAAKRADPSAKIGVSVANFDVNFLERAIEAGAAGHFDFICVHPYEKLDLLEAGGEIEFMAMASTLRRMLASHNLDNSLPLWISEVGAVATTEPRSEAGQSRLLTKAYVLALASGFEKIFWFEARGPAYHDQADHGLLRTDFSPRPSFEALATLIRLLGDRPTYLGWVRADAEGLGFVFEGRQGPVLAAWTTSNKTVETTFQSPVLVTRTDGSEVTLDADKPLSLSSTPQFVSKLPDAIVQQAKKNRDLPILQDVDFSKVDAVAISLGETNRGAGLQQINPQTTKVFADEGSTSRRLDFSVANNEGHYAYFAVSPQFVPWGTRRLQISATVKRLPGSPKAGFSLDYESQKGYVNASYREIPSETDWQELTWTIDDANFVGQWGWHFRINAIASPSEFLVKDIRVEKRP